LQEKQQQYGLFLACKIKPAPAEERPAETEQITHSLQAEQNIMSAWFFNDKKINRITV